MTCGDYTYKTNATGQATIIGFNTNYAGTLVITNALSGCRVTGIASTAFQSCREVTELTIPAGVKNIGYAAFRDCSGLKRITVDATNMDYTGLNDVLFNKNQTTLLLFPGAKTGHYTIPATVTNISSEAFRGCTGLTDLAIPANVTKFNMHMISGCSSLQAITVDAANSNYSSMDGVLFNDDGTVLIKYPNARAGSYTIPAGVTDIGDLAFSGCTNLTNITIPSSFPKVLLLLPPPASKFSGCTSLTNVTVAGGHGLGWTSVDGVVFSQDNTTLILCPPGRMGHFVIPEGVTTIAGDAFRGCARLTDVKIPANCEYIQKKPTLVSRALFSGCASLTNIAVASGHKSGWSSIDGVIYAQDGATLIRCPPGRTGHFAVPEGVTTISEDSFASCIGLTSITTPGTLLHIRAGAFSGCSRLTSFTLPARPIKIEEDAFSGCTNISPAIVSRYYGASVSSPLTYGDYTYRTYSVGEATIIGFSNTNYAGALVITNTLGGCPVTRIDRGSFRSCTNLTNVTIPGSVIDLDTWAFDECPVLTAINVDPANRFYKSADGVLFDKSQTQLMNYPLGRAGDYVVPARVTAIAFQAFWHRKHLTGITLPRDLLFSGSEFEGCTALKTITVATDHPRYTSVDGVLFDKARTCLIRFPKGRTGPYAVPVGVTNIDNSAFNGCSELTAINVDGTNPVYRSQDGVLFNKELTTLVRYPAGKAGQYSIPPTVTNIGYFAFADGVGLESVTIPASVTAIGYGAFQSCTGLTNVTIGTGVTSIGGSAFYDCRNLTDAAIPDGVTRIEDHAFAGCTSLTNITIPASVTHIGKNVFPGYGKLPASVRDRIQPPERVRGMPAASSSMPLGREAWRTRAASTNEPRLTGEALRKHLQEFQMELIRKGESPLPIPLTKGMETQLVKEGVLAPIEDVQRGKTNQASQAIGAEAAPQPQRWR